MHSLSKKPQYSIPGRRYNVTNTDDRQHRSILKRIAHRAMIERGLIPDFPVQVLAQLNGIQGPATRT